MATNCCVNGSLGVIWNGRATMSLRVARRGWVKGTTFLRIVPNSNDPSHYILVKCDRTHKIILQYKIIFCQFLKENNRIMHNTLPKFDIENSQGWFKNDWTKSRNYSLSTSEIHTPTLTVKSIFKWFRVRSSLGSSFRNHFDIGFRWLKSNQNVLGQIN